MINMIKGYIPDKLWKQVEEWMPIPCVQAIIYDVYREKLLLVKRTNKPAKGKYWFIGGRIKYGQTIIEAIREQLKEELGIDHDKFIIKFYSATGSVFNTRHTIEINFMVMPIDSDLPEIKLNSESLSYRWFGLKEIPSYLRGYLERHTVNDFYFPHF